MPVKHAHQTALPNDPTKDISADAWNDDHDLSGLAPSEIAGFDAAALAAAVSDAIANGESKAPSQNAVFDALALKAPLASPSFTGTVTVGGALVYSGIISPAQISSNQADYAPTGHAAASIIRINSDAARAIFSLDGATAGRVVSLVNVGSHDILLASEYTTGTTAAMRFSFQRPVILAPNAAIELWYDGTSSRWRAAGRPASPIKVLAADYTSTGTDTLSDVTGYGFAVLSGFRYRYRFVAVVDTPTINNGWRFAANGPTLTSLDHAYTTHNNTSRPQVSGLADTWDLPATGPLNSGLTAGTLAEVWGVLVPSADGTVIGRIASENAGGTNQVTVKAGVSIIEYECIGP